MKKEFIYPDYSNCNINISASLAEFLGAPHSLPTLPLLNRELVQKPKNIVFICFDGMGVHPLMQNLPEDSFLRSNIASVLTSTFPSTTTCATTSLRTNTLPYEHGWFGWTMYIPHLDRNIDIFNKVDSWTKQPVDVSGWPLRDFPSYYEGTDSGYNTVTVAQRLTNNLATDNTRYFDNADELFDTLYDICSSPGRQFIYAYYSEPDSLMHRFGVTCDVTAAFLAQLSQNTAQLYSSTKDTLFIITADHGQVDVGENIHIYKDEELMETILLYPYLEPRAVCFRVKTGRARDFERIFTQRYVEDFELFPSGELIGKGLFGGKGELCSLLGDYIAVGNYTHKIIRMSPTDKLYKGHHTSLTEEMEVPLILLRN